MGVLKHGAGAVATRQWELSELGGEISDSESESLYEMRKSPAIARQCLAGQPNGTLLAVAWIHFLILPTTEVCISYFRKPFINKGKQI